MMTGEIVWWLRGLAYFILVATPLIWLSLAVYYLRKMSAAYELLGPRAKQLGFYWFSAQFSLGSFARGMPGYLDPDTFPPDISARFSTLRKQARQSTWVMYGWLGFVLFCGILSALFTRNIHK
jgi:hypothetical protein